MDRITEHIWIGNSEEAKDRGSLQAAGIRSMLCLDGCMTQVGAQEAGVERVCKLFMQEGNSLVEAMRKITSKRKVAIGAGLQDFLD